MRRFFLFFFSQALRQAIPALLFSQVFLAWQIASFPFFVR